MFDNCVAFHAWILFSNLATSDYLFVAILVHVVLKTLCLLHSSCKWQYLLDGIVSRC